MNNSISLDEVMHLAKLSSLSVSKEEAESLQKDLSKIVDYADQLNELDTDNVEPTFQITGLSNVWREDDDIDSYGGSPEALVSLAKDSKNGQINVPKVL